jgi:hypothetical protein
MCIIGLIDNARPIINNGIAEGNDLVWLVRELFCDSD